jgi:hypothetical protein
VPDDRIEQGSDRGGRFGGGVEALREFVRGVLPATQAEGAAMGAFIPGE